MQTISVVIVDDEQKSLDLITSLLEEIPGVKIQGTYINPCIAKLQIADHQPDIVFLDVEMPQLNGLELFDHLRLSGCMSEIVFVTGYDTYAIKAIKKSAFDYILKPVSLNDLVDVFTKYKVKCYKRNEQLFLTEKSIHGKIRFNTLQGFYVVEVVNIVYVKADGNYCEIYMSDGYKRLVTSNMAHVENILEPYLFRRIGRSHLINVSYLTQVDRKNGYCILRYEHSQVELPVNKSRVKDLMELF